MHPLLERQVKRCELGADALASVRELLALVDAAYSTADLDRDLGNRSFDVVEKALRERNEELASNHAEVQRAHEDLQRLTEELERHVTVRTAELKEAEKDYRTIFEMAPVGIFRTSREGRYLKCNPALAALYGYDSPEDLMTRVVDIKRRLYVEDGVRERFIAEINAHGQVTEFEARIYRKNGEIIWISETARVVRGADGAVAYFEGFVVDITARKLAEERVRESEERYALAMQGANDGIWDWSLREGRVYYSARWKEMLGEREEGVGMLPEEWFKRVHPEDLKEVQGAIAAHRAGTTPHFEIEHRMRHADGRYLWMLSRGLATRDETGAATRMAGSQTDITARKEVEAQLVRDALHDGLTGLPNRVLFLDRLERSIMRSKRDGGHTFAVLFLDLDRFKVINDSLGHVVGDQLLVEFARRLSACVRASDTVARLGGDEFTILIEDPSAPDDAAGVAERVLESFKRPFALGANEVFVTTSIGVTTSAEGYERPQDVLRDADTAMYRAKALGKSRAEVFDPSMHARALKTLQIENDLRRAMDRGEFVLHYQPITNMETGRIKAFEALVRWQHPERGLISPGDFIPVAEETGLIIQLGRWVLDEGCRQAAEWNRAYPEHAIGMNINLSGKQFTQADLVEQVMGALHRHGLAATSLTLEITESVVMENPEATILMLKRLKELGVTLNIDDFGTGYSSLAYLQRFPIDTMKIDRSFVKRMEEGPENAEIVKTIVELAHNLKMKVTAEGIETADQLARLKHLNCDHGQGYYLSKPVDAGRAEGLLRESGEGGAEAA